jgi:O-antigen/teichoic acid export membrane protein
MAKAEIDAAGSVEPLTSAEATPAPVTPVEPAVGVGTRLLRSTGWALAGTIASRVFTMLSAVAVARMLGRGNYGELGVVQSTLATFQLFANFGLGVTATRYVAQLRTTDPARAGRIIGLSHLVALATGGGAATALILGSDWLAREALAAPQLGSSLKIVALVVFVTAFNGSQVGALTGLEAFRDVARINVVTAAATVPVMLACVFLDGVRGAVWAMLWAAALHCFLSQRAMGRHARRHGIVVVHRGALRDVGVLWRFTVPAVLAGLFVQPITWLCNALLVNQPGGYQEMGTFNAATQWRTLLYLVPSMIMQAVLPVLSSAHAESARTSQFQRSLNITQSLMVCFAFPVAALLMFGAESLLRLYGSEFPGSGAVLVGALATALVQSIGAATGPAIEARGRMWFAFTINVSWGVLYVLGAFAGVGRWGALALAFGQALASVVVTLWAFAAMRSELPRGMFTRVLASLASAAALTVAAVATPRHLQLELALPACALATAIAWLFLADREVVSQAFRRARQLRRGA